MVSAGPAGRARESCWCNLPPRGPGGSAVASTSPGRPPPGWLPHSPSRPWRDCSGRGVGWRTRHPGTDVVDWISAPAGDGCTLSWRVLDGTTRFRLWGRLDPGHRALLRVRARGGPAAGRAVGVAGPDRVAVPGRRRRPGLPAGRRELPVRRWAGWCCCDRARRSGGCCRLTGTARLVRTGLTLVPPGPARRDRAGQPARFCPTVAAPVPAAALSARCPGIPRP
jgi:hypothetical protein